MKLKIENLISIGNIIPDLKVTHNDCSCCLKETKIKEMTKYEEKNEYFCPVCILDGSASRHILFNFAGTVAEFTDTINRLGAVL